MMIIFKPKTWNGFKRRIEDIRNKYGIIHEGADFEQKNPILFRGHANHKWKLDTTLERHYKKSISPLEYLEKATLYVEEIEVFSGNNWDLPSFPDIRDKIEKLGPSLRNIPCYEYLVYLRHFGFPSPLLDWSTSPFIATFLAISEVSSEENPAVYVYVPSVNGVRGGEASAPRINIHGPYVKSNKRHFSQKAWYTTATIYKSDQHQFINHEEVFKENNHKQDLLFKIILPIKLKQSILEELNEYNINYFTIFHSEDSLIKSIAMKAFK